VTTTATVSARPAPLPPGPSADRLTQGTLFHRDPLGFLRRNREQFGDVFTIHLAVSGPMVVFASPAAMPQLLDSDPERAHAGEARRRILGMVSPRSVLGADDARHRTARGRVAGVFTPEAMDGRRDAMARIAEMHVAQWPRGRPFRLLPRMRALADEVFARLVVGVRDPARARALAVATQKMLWTPGNPPLPPPGDGAGLMGALGKRLFDRRKREPSRLLAEEIEVRRRTGDDGACDLIGCMLTCEPPLETNAMVDELLPLLMAGQEPPAAGLTWLLDRLGREPGLDEEFLALPDGDPRKDAIEREALRLRPAVHSIVRRQTRETEIDGQALPEGAVAMGPIVLVHRDEAAYPNADDFRPERFMADDADALPHAPFGGGARRCLGEPLAHALIGTVLPTILRSVRLEPVLRAPERMVVRGTVLVPHRSGLVAARAR
jgi:cytochrome P450 family 135